MSFGKYVFLNVCMYAFDWIGVFCMNQPTLLIRRAIVNPWVALCFAGSPFFCSIIDGSKVSASGDGLRLIPVGQPAGFVVQTNGVGEANLDVDITCKSLYSIHLCVFCFCFCFEHCKSP